MPFSTFLPLSPPNGGKRQEQPIYGAIFTAENCWNHGSSEWWKSPFCRTMIFCRIYGRIWERSDASFQHSVVPCDTRAENCFWPQFCAFSAFFQWEEKCRISSFFLWLEIWGLLLPWGRPGPDALDRCVSVCDGQFRTLDFRGSVRKQVYNTWESCKNDCHRPTPSYYVFVFRGLSLESPLKT